MSEHFKSIIDHIRYADSSHTERVKSMLAKLINDYDKVILKFRNPETGMPIEITEDRLSYFKTQKPQGFIFQKATYSTRQKELRVYLR